MQDFFSQLDGRIFSFDFGMLFNTEYLFNPDPGATEFQAWYYAIAFGFVILSATGILVLRRLKLDGVYRVLIRKFLRYTLWIGLCLVVLAFARGQGIRILDMRIWPLLLLILEVVNLGYLVYQLIRKEPKKKEQIKRVSEYQKYLPRKKKNN